MHVKIVHPGGHVELHDRPVMAAEIMLRNPRCIVAHPNVFKEPWAIVAPDTVLNLGQKFYVVPIGTIRKLQRLNSFKYSPPVEGDQTIKTCDDAEENSRNSRTSWKKVNRDSGSVRNPSKDKCFSDDNCFKCLIPGTKIDKGNGGNLSEGTTSASSSFSSSETKRLTRKRTKDLTKASPKSYATMDHWQPSLESITEEH